MPIAKYLTTGPLPRVLALYYFTILSPAVLAQNTQATLTYKGNIFEVKNIADTVTILDPVTTEIETIINNPDPIPVKMNAMNIYSREDVEKAPSVNGDILKRYIIQSLHQQITALGDGQYRLVIRNVIISEKGRVVYYNFDGIEKMSSRRQYGKADEKNIVATAGGPTNQTSYLVGWKRVENSMNKNMSLQLESIIAKAPVYTPAKVYNNPVPYRLPDEEMKKPFYIRKGAISYN